MAWLVPLFFLLPFATIVNSRLETQRQTIYHYWLNGIQSPKEIHRKTNISYRTVLDNLKKLRDTGTIEHKKGNGWSSKVTPTITRAVGQKVRRIIVPYRHINLPLPYRKHKIFPFHMLQFGNIWKKKKYESSIPRPSLVSILSLGTGTLTGQLGQNYIYWWDSVWSF